MKRWYFRWVYLFRPPWGTGVPVPELVRVMENLPPGRALDLGCGTGTNLLYLAERGWRVAGIDFVAAAVANARKQLAGRPATLLEGDVARLADLPLGEPFDLVLDVGCYHSLSAKARKGYAAGVRKWLRRKGIFLLYAFQPDSPASRNGLSKAEVLAEFADGFCQTGYEQGKGRPSAWYYFERL